MSPDPIFPAYAISQRKPIAYHRLVALPNLLFAVIDHKAVPYLKQENIENT